MYDSVTKFLIETCTTDYATWLLGNPIELTKLEPSELSLEPIRADSLVFLEGEDIILHIESQTRPNEDIFFRLLDYRVRLYRRSPSKQVKQVVIYLLPSSSALVYQTSFEIRSADLTSKPSTYHQFEVVRLWEIPAEQLLSSPGLMPLAVLGKTNNMENTLREVAQQIDRVDDARLRSNLAASSAVLGALKLDKDVIKQILRRDIMRESPIYQEILEEGMQAGMERGKREGKQEGIQVGMERGKQEGIQVGVERGKQEGIQVGMERGKQEGSREKAYVIARNLLSLGMTIEQVALATELSIEQINFLTQN